MAEETNSKVRLGSGKGPPGLNPEPPCCHSHHINSVLDANETLRGARRVSSKVGGLRQLSRRGAVAGWSWGRQRAPTRSALVLLPEAFQKTPQQAAPELRHYLRTIAKQVEHFSNRNRAPKGVWFAEGSHPSAASTMSLSALTRNDGASLTGRRVGSRLHRWGVSFEAPPKRPEDTNPVCLTPSAGPTPESGASG